MRQNDKINKAIAKIRRIAAFPKSYTDSKKLLKEIEESKINKTDIVIVLLKGIGDSVYGLAYIESLVESTGPVNVTVIGNSKLKDFILSYPCVSRFVPYDVSKGEYEKYKAFMDCERIRKIKGFDTIYNTDPFHVYKRGKENNTALYLLREKVYKLSNQSKVTFPPLGNMQVTAISDFDRDANRIVIINPYSNSITNISLETYKKMADVLKSAGFYVYTNLIMGQKPIDGTKELYCSVEELAEIVKKAAGIISIRSGILDLVINSGTPIFAIYSNCSEKYRTIYDLRAWNGASPLSQVNYDSVGAKGLMDRFILWIEELKHERKQ